MCPDLFRENLLFPPGSTLARSGEVGRHALWQRGSKFCHHLSWGEARKSWVWVPGLELSVHGNWEIGRIDLPFGQHAWDLVTLATSCLSS